VQKFTIEFYSLVEFAPPAVHRSAARGPTRKTFYPKFLENPPAYCRHFCTLDRANIADKNPGICPSSFLWLGVGSPQKWHFCISKTNLLTPQLYFTDRSRRRYDEKRWKKFRGRSARFWDFGF